GRTYPLSLHDALPISRGSRVRRRARRCYFLRPCFVSSAIRSARRSRVSLQPWFWPRPGTPGGVVCRTVSFVLPPSSANVTVVRRSEEHTSELQSLRHL